MPIRLSSQAELLVFDHDTSAVGSAQSQAIRTTGYRGEGSEHAVLAFGAQRRLRFGWLKQRAVYLPSQALLLQDVRLKELPNLSLRSNTSFLLLDVEIRVRTARVEQDERARSFGDSLARWPRHRHRFARRAAAPPAVSSTATADRTGQSGLTTRLAASAGLQLPRGGGGGKRHCSASCCCRAWRDMRAGRFSSRRRDGPIGLRQGKRSTGLARQAKPPLFSPGLAPRALEASHARPRKSPAIICSCARASAPSNGALLNPRPSPPAADFPEPRRSRAWGGMRRTSAQVQGAAPSLLPGA